MRCVNPLAHSPTGTMFDINIENDAYSFHHEGTNLWLSAASV